MLYLSLKGYNLRTTKYGIFPSAYATDLSILELDGKLPNPMFFSPKLCILSLKY